MELSSEKERYAQLKQQIHFHNHRYHVLDDPLISDLEYDRLMVELRQIESVHPDWVTPDSPTQRAGAVISDKFEKVRHPRPILSLANAFGAEDAHAWYERVCKLDDRVGTDAVRRRAEDRWVERGAALPGRPLRPGRHARRRGDRRGYHGQFADGQSDSVENTGRE